MRIKDFTKSISDTFLPKKLRKFLKKVHDKIMPPILQDLEKWIGNIKYSKHEDPKNVRKEK